MPGYSFATTIGPGFEIQDHTMWAALIAAVNERLQALPSYSITGAHVEAGDPFAMTTYTSVVAGTNIQLQEWWNYTGALDQVQIFYQMPQSWTTTPFPLGMQAAILYMLPFFVDHTLTYDGATTDPFTSWVNASIFSPSAVPSCVWSMPTIRSAAGLPTTINPAAAGNPNYVPNSWFRRKRPREISGTSATSDYQGNSAIAGQRAYIPGYGQLYICVSSGNWTPDDTGPVDVLDNTLNYPNAITTYSGFGGFVEQGDYLGSWVFDEVRCMVNQLRWRWDIIVSSVQGDFSGTKNTQNTLDSQTSSVSFSDLMTKLYAHWGTPTSSASAGFPQAFWYASGSWGGFGSRTDSTWTVGNLGTLTKDVDWYVYAVPTTALGDVGPGPGTLQVWDAQGDNVVQNTFHLWHSSGGVTGTSVTAPKFGDATVYPPTPPVDPNTVVTGSNPAGINAIGYQITDSVAISKFAFAYTF